MYFADIGTLSDVGCSRTNNQDSIGLVRFPDSRNLLAIVADGMGGHQGGEVASQMAVQIMQQNFPNAIQDNTCIQALKNSFMLANTTIYKAAQETKALSGMGTTLMVLAIIDGYAHYAYTGDSRLYLLQGGECLQISEDHTLVAEMLKGGLITLEAAENHPEKHVITAAIGTKLNPKIDTSIAPHPIKIGDGFLLCSDGLYDLVKASEMNQIITNHPAQEACKQLIQLANSRGGYDNTSVIVIKVTAEPVTFKPLLITRV